MDLLKCPLTLDVSHLNCEVGSQFYRKGGGERGITPHKTASVVLVEVNRHFLFCFPSLPPPLFFFPPFLSNGHFAERLKEPTIYMQRRKEKEVCSDCERLSRSEHSSVSGTLQNSNLLYVKFSWILVRLLMLSLRILLDKFTNCKVSRYMVHWVKDWL